MKISVGTIAAFLCLGVFALSTGCGGGSSSAPLTSTTPPPDAAPTITSIAPTSIPAGSAASTLTVNGTGFLSTTTIQVGQTVEATTYVSSTQVTATIPATQLVSGAILSVIAHNGSTTTASGADVNLEIDNPAPAIAQVSPATLTVGSPSATISVAGTGFVPTTVININGSGRSTAYSSSTAVSVVLTAADLAASGSLSIAAVNPTPGGGSSPTTTLVVTNPTPGVITLAPSSVAVGTATPTKVTVTGSNFVPSSTVQIGGTIHATTFVSATQLTFQLSVADQASAASLSVTVVNPPPGGGSSPIATLLVSNPRNPAPILDALAPSSVTAGGPAFTLTVMGTDFIATSQVKWNGIARTTSFASSTQLTVAIQASDIASPGTASVSVVNPSPGGGVSQTLSFAISNPPSPVPVLDTLAPASATSGGPAFTLTLTGAAFVPQSQVNWNGTARTTTFVSSTQLTAAINATDIASAGTSSITVVNPAPGGGTSAPVTFSINPLSTVTTTNLTVLEIEGGDLVWNQSQQKIYVSVPGDASADADTITVVDPIAGSILNSQSTSAAPQVLSISDDDQFLYTTLEAENAIQRFTLPGLSPDIKVTLGTDPNYDEQMTPSDVKVEPGSAHTFAVATIGVNTQEPLGTGVVVYDDVVPRTNSVADSFNNYDSLQWKQDGTQIFAEDNSSSDQALLTLSVNQSGVSTLASYGHAFAFGGNHLHVDLASSYVYSDQGNVVNALTGLPVGNYAAPRANYYDAWGAIDSTLQRIFFLTMTQGSSGNIFQIQVYDQKHFTPLGSITIPNVVGVPANLIRWGTSGLAFVTNGLKTGAPSTGKLYLLDGAFVNPSGAMDSTIGTPLTPAPTLNSLSPLAATVNSGSVIITVNGENFTGKQTLQWNGSSLATSVISPSQLTALVPASDLMSSTLAAVTVVNPGPGGGTSNKLYFAVNPALPAGNTLTVYPTGGIDLAWDSSQQKLYVSMPSEQGSIGNAIASVDPVSGSIVTTPFIGSDPAKLSISSNDQWLYVGLNGQNALQRLMLPALTPDISWPLGSDPFEGAYSALDLQSAPGLPGTTAITTAFCCGSPNTSGVAIYDDGVARPTTIGEYQPNPYFSLQWNSDATALYSSEEGVPTDLFTLAVNASGVSLSKDFPSALQGTPTGDLAIHYDAGTGYIYADTGVVVNLANGALVNNFNLAGIALPDSTTNRVFYLGQTTEQTGTADYTVEAFNETTFAPISSIVVSNVVGVPTAFKRWGSNGIAITTITPSTTNEGNLASGPGQLYVISGSFVNGSPSPDALPKISPSLKLHKIW